MWPLLYLGFCKKVLGLLNATPTVASECRLHFEQVWSNLCLHIDTMQDLSLSLVLMAELVKFRWFHLNIIHSKSKLHLEDINSHTTQNLFLWILCKLSPGRFIWTQQPLTVAVALLFLGMCRISGEAEKSQKVSSGFAYFLKTTGFLCSF